MLGVMFDAECRFAIAHAKIISETLDGETLIIDLSRGLYFSLNRSASIVWQMALEGIPYGSLTPRVRELCKNVGDIDGDIERFFQLLNDEALLVVSNDTSGTKEAIATQYDSFAYTPPAMERHNDLESLLLADPVHEFND